MTAPTQVSFSAVFRTNLLKTAIALSALPVCFSAIPTHAAELVANGGFEQPVLNSGTFGYFASIPSWSLLPGSKGNGIEIQNTAAGNAFEGKQLVELDSNGVTGIFQDLFTTVGETYQLKFAFSPRPGVAQNLMNIYWGGNLVDALSANGVGLTNPNWQVFTYNLTASNAVTRLSFDNLNEVSDTLGSYVDGVSVSAAVPEPTSILGVLAFGSWGAARRLRRKQS